MTIPASRCIDLTARYFRYASILLIFILLSVTSALAATSDSEPLYFIYHGEHKMFTLDAKHIAVRTTLPAPTTSSTTTQFPAGLTANRLSSADVVARPVDGWMILDAGNVLTTATRNAGGSLATATDQPQGAAIHELITALLNSGDASIEFVSPVFRDERGGPILLTPTLLIGFRASFTPVERERLLEEIPEGASVKKSEFPQPFDESWTIKSRDGFAVLARANALAQKAGVAYAEPDMIVTGYANLIPSDPSFSQSWGLSNTGQFGGQPGFDMGVTAAWDTTLGSSSVIVLVMDSGIQQNHPDINQVTGRDFTSDSNSNPNGGPFGPYDNHGTWVAGCISGRINNGIGSTGVAPGVKAASARCGTNYQADRTFSAFLSWFADALYWGQSIGARVSNNSNGLGGPSSALESAYANTRANGMVHFASAGNGGTSSIGYPASVSSVNSVAAADRFGQRSSFSQYGTGLKFTAPGDEIFTTDRTGSDGGANGDYYTVSGTSFASPYAAGVAALVISQNPTFTADQVETAMAVGCTDMGITGYDTDYGYGLVNAFRALASRLPNLSPYQPSGWSNKIVVSNVTSTNTDSASLAATDTLYLDWAVINNGNANVTTNFVVELYVDGTFRASWTASPPTNINIYRSVLDYNIGSLSVGTHTLRIKVDSSNAVAESDENDNEYTKTITIGNDALPNLTPYQPSGWANKIVVSSVTGTSTDSATLSPTDILYLDWAVINNSDVDITTTFTTELYVDNVLKTRWTASPPTNAHFYRYVQDYNLGSLSVGTHTVRIKTDSANAILESNEGDNEYTKTITIVTVNDRPNLTPYQPGGWSNKIVVSNVTGTNGDSAILRPTDVLYLDWAVINNGNADITANFITELYVDGVLRASWTSPPPTSVNGYRYVSDYNIGSLNVGTHTLRIKADSTNVIGEQNEGDNEYTRTINVITGPADSPPDLNSDGKADLIWQSASTGQVYLWFMDGQGNEQSGRYLGNGDFGDWKVVGAGDLNSDGKTDLIWQSASTGQVYLWFMDGQGNEQSGRYLGNGDFGDWKVVAVGDLNGDGKIDLIWQSASTGQVYIWFMDGQGNEQSGRYLGSGDFGDWKVVGAGDLNSDGKTDLIWQSASTGQVYLWFMDGQGNEQSGRYLGNGDFGDWKVVGAEDLNSDGKTDLIWQSASTGQVYLWFMDGQGNERSGRYLGNGNFGDWKIRP
jgi:subtilisin family serine protease